MRALRIIPHFLFLLSLNASAEISPLHDRISCPEINTARAFGHGGGYSALDRILVNGGKELFSVARINDAWVDDLRLIRDFLIQNGDTHIAHEQLCVGLYPFQEFNAYSHPWGYIGVDPSVREMMNEKLEKRSMASMRQVLFHEFAHQLQFWHGNAFQSDANVKRSELTADCIGGALNAALGMQRYGTLWNEVAAGIRESAASVGDFHFESDKHHGTPIERVLATNAGFDLMESAPEALFRSFSGINLLRRCELWVKTL